MPLHPRPTPGGQMVNSCEGSMWPSFDSVEVGDKKWEPAGMERLLAMR